MWTYIIPTGELLENGEHVAAGYSGNGAGRNNAAMDNVKNVGPLPRGTYRMTVDPPKLHAHLADPVIRLNPLPGTEMHSRNGILCHGDNAAHDASGGCMIQGAMVRLRMAEKIRQPFPDDVLEVLAEAPATRPASSGAA